MLSCIAISRRIRPTCALSRASSARPDTAGRSARSCLMESVSAVHAGSGFIPMAVMSAPIASSMRDAMTSCMLTIPATCDEIAASESRCARIIGIRESLRIPIPCMPVIPGMLPMPGIACCGADSFFPQAAATSTAVIPAIILLFMLPPSLIRQSSAAPQVVDDWDYDQRQDCGRHHPAYHRRGDPLHHARPRTVTPQRRHEPEHDREHRHELRPHAVDRAVLDGAHELRQCGTPPAL